MYSDEENSCDEEGLLLNDDEMEDVCIHCGCRDRYYDATQWESACANCGIVGIFENETEVPDLYLKPKTYFKHEYFSNTILRNAMERGYKLSRDDMKEYVRLYILVVAKFYSTQKEKLHRRKYFISSNFVLMKIGDMKGKDVRKHIDLPKQETLLKLELLWKIINPF